MVQRHVLQIFLKLVVKQETFCYIGFSLVLCTPQHSQEILFLANMFLMPTKCIFSVLICTRCYGGLVNNFCCRTSDDGTCRIWDALDSSRKSRVYMPSPKEPPTSMMILLWWQDLLPLVLESVPFCIMFGYQWVSFGLVLHVKMWKDLVSLHLLHPPSSTKLFAALSTPMAAFLSLGAQIK